MELVVKRERGLGHLIPFDFGSRMEVLDLQLRFSDNHLLHVLFSEVVSHVGLDATEALEVKCRRHNQ